MSDTPPVTSTELILQVSLARIPFKVSGVIQDEELSEVSGCVSIEKPLATILQDLGADYGEGANVLSLLLGKAGADIGLDKLAFAYHRNSDSKSIQAGLLMTVGDSRCQFALLKSLGEQGFIAGLDFQLNKTIPKKYNILSGLIGDIAIGDLGIYYANQDFKKRVFYPADAYQDANQVLPKIVAVKRKDFPKGLSFSADILIGGVNVFELLQQGSTDSLNSALLENTSPESDTRTSVESVKSTSADDVEKTLSTGLTKWFKVDKKIGPVRVRRVGLSYDAPNVGIKFDAGFTLACLTLSLDGMGISYPLNKISRDPKIIWKNLKFHLDGAGVAFAQGPLAMSGNLLKVKDDPLQLDGALLIKTGIFSISALGSYTTINGSPSFFVYAALQKELGGPAFFFVTGLAFGFGINRSLKLPALNDVQSFPLIKAATDVEYLKNADMRSISARLEEYIAPSEGDIWIAAGVKFTSFGQIDSFALLSVSFGTQFEVGLLGLSKLAVPKPPAKTIAYAELAMKAVFAPDSGLLSFEARLTENSYILRKDFILRGGFAFYSWFAGAHDGDFVISIGGYHPKFQPPTHYPRPDLVEFHCKIGNTTIQGHCYFALCPSAIMAGGGLSIVYQSKGIKAWFIAYADFLIQWRPLYYEISIGVSVGVALNLKVVFVRVKLSVELAASVYLYGPPLGGKARISLAIITFTVNFGEARSLPLPLQWESSDPEKSFAQSFLPNPAVSRLSVLPNPAVTHLSVSDGLLGELKNGEKTIWCVSPHKLSLSCRTLVPATAAQFNNLLYAYDNVEENQKIPKPRLNRDKVDLAVRPMGKSSLYSLIKVTLEPGSNASENAKKYLAQYIEVSLATKSVPIALWGKPGANKNTPPKANEQMIDDVLVGFEIKTKPGPRPWETPALDLNVLAYDRYSKKFEWASVLPREALPAFGHKTIANTIEKLDELEVRARIKKGSEWLLPLEDGPKRKVEIETRVKDVVAWSNQVSLTRAAVLKRLAKTGRKVLSPQEVHLPQVSENAQYLFQAAPIMARVGQYPPRDYRDT